jgi:hypothetical protein
LLPSERREEPIKGHEGDWEHHERALKLRKVDAEAQGVFLLPKMGAIAAKKG